METDRKLRFDGVRDWFLSDEVSFNSTTSCAETDSTSSGSSPLTPTSSSSLHPPINFRPIQPQDREVIQSLHEEWFPVTYHDEFYDDLVRNGQQHCWGILKNPPTHHRVPGSQSPASRSLFTCLAVRNDEEDASVCACVVGCFLPASQMMPRLRQLLLPLHHSRAFYIMTLGVVSSFRNEGLGSRMVQKCERLVQQDKDCGVLYLHVITYNHAAIRLYEKLGFFRVEEIENYYTINGTSHNALLYAKYFHGNRGHRRVLSLVKETARALWRQMVSAFPVLLQLLPHRYEQPRIQQRTL